VLVAWHSAPGSADAVRWGLVAALFAGLVPMAYIVREVRRRRLLEALPGTALSEVSGFGPVQLDRVLFQVGEHLRELHALTAAGCLGCAPTATSGHTNRWHPSRPGRLPSA
jgi:hypothetical protein